MSTLVRHSKYMLVRFSSVNIMFLMSGREERSHAVCEEEIENWITSKGCPLLAVMSPSNIDIHWPFVRCLMI